MNERDDLLRAAVYHAFDLRGTAGSSDACRDVVDGFVLWPAVECELALERARTQVAATCAQREADLNDAIELLRSTYGDARGRAA